MKRLIVCLVFITCIGSAALLAEPPAAPAEPADLIILLDTSKSVFSFFNDLIEYIISDTLTYHVRFGDRVHLITFATKPEIEISQVVANKDDIETFLKRVLLLQALGNYTDLISAFKYLYQYTLDLPTNTKKTILILTDGIHDPPGGSQFSADKEETRKELKDIIAAINSRDWDVRILNLPKDYSAQEDSLFNPVTAELSPESISQPESQVPAAGSPASRTPETAGGAPAGQDNLQTSQESGPKISIYPFLPDDNSIPVTDYNQDSLDTITNKAFGTPRIQFPSNLGKVGYRFRFPLTVTNYRDSFIIFSVSGVIWEQNNILAGKVSARIDPENTKDVYLSVEIPADMEAGDHVLQVELQFPEELQNLKASGELSFSLTSAFRYNYGKALIIALLVTAGLAFLAGLFFLVKFLRKTFEALAWRPGEPVKTIYDVYRKYRSHELRRPIEMKVDSQNTKIGMRNVHTLEEGSFKTLGGAGSSYFIFLYHIPNHIAKITFDGESYIFTPLKTGFFPQIKEPLVNCLDLPISVSTETGKEFSIRFVEYVSPLEKINRILHLTDEPGLPEDWPLSFH